MSRKNPNYSTDESPALYNIFYNESPQESCYRNRHFRNRWIQSGVTISEEELKLVRRSFSQSINAVGVAASDEFVSTTFHDISRDAWLIDVTSLGQLPLPLSVKDAEKLKGKCVQAPFGLGRETIVDTNVRRAWQLDASQVKLRTAGWTNHPQFVLQTTLQHVCKQLAITHPESVVANLYKLVLYEEGGFFLPHKDSEKEPGMFGTLVMQLPVIGGHSGGTLKVSHKNKSCEIDCNLTTNINKMIFATAFFADCDHELMPITSGWRLVLTYNLVWSKPDVAVPQLRTPNSALAELTNSVHHWMRQQRSVPTLHANDFFVMELDHQYSQKSLSFSMLKGKDAATYQTLLQVKAEDGSETDDPEPAAAPALEMMLLLCEKVLSGKTLGDDEDTFDKKFCRREERKCRRMAGEKDVSDDSDTSEEGDTESAYLDHRFETHQINFTPLLWVPCPTNQIPLDVSGFTKYFEPVPTNGDTAFESKFNPVRGHYSKYRGNESAYLEHEYHSAFLLVWPRERTLHVHAALTMNTTKAFRALFLPQSQHITNAFPDWFSTMLQIQLYEFNKAATDEFSFDFSSKMPKLEFGEAYTELFKMCAEHGQAHDAVTLLTDMSNVIPLTKAPRQDCYRHKPESVTSWTDDITQQHNITESALSSVGLLLHHFHTSTEVMRQFMHLATTSTCIEWMVGFARRLLSPVLPACLPTEHIAWARLGMEIIDTALTAMSTTLCYVLFRKNIHVWQQLHAELSDPILLAKSTKLKELSFKSAMGRMAQWNVQHQHYLSDTSCHTCTITHDVCLLWRHGTRNERMLFAKMATGLIESVQLIRELTSAADLRNKSTAAAVADDDDDKAFLELVQFTAVMISSLPKPGKDVLDTLNVIIPDRPRYAKFLASGQAFSDAIWLEDSIDPAAAVKALKGCQSVMSVESFPYEARGSGYLKCKKTADYITAHAYQFYQTCLVKWRKRKWIE